MRENAAIVALVPDLMFGTSVQDTLTKAGYSVVFSQTMMQALERLQEQTVQLIIVDLQSPGLELASLVAAAKEAGVPVLAFGRHTETEVLARAKATGCAGVVPRSRFFIEMQALVAHYARSASPSER